MSDQIQEICESIVMSALGAAPALSATIRHDDAAARVVVDMISVKADAPVPRLEGERGYRCEVEVTIRSKTATANAATHASALERLTTAATMLTAATAAGLGAGDDLTILNEEIGGDRSEGKNLRKRTITIPFIIGMH